MHAARFRAMVAMVLVLVSTSLTCDAFSKTHPTEPPVGFKPNGEADSSHPRFSLQREQERAKIEAALPNWSDPVDREMMECTACLCVSDVIASRFSKLKGEFKFTMEKLREFHLEAALDDICTKEARFIGLIMPNHTHPGGKRAIDRYLKEVLPEENQRKVERVALREKLVKAGKANGGKEWEALSTAETQAVARRSKQIRDSVIIFPEYGDEREIYNSIIRMRRDQRGKETKEERIARKQKQRELAEKGEVDPDLEDAPPVADDGSMTKIDDVSVVKTLELTTRWQQVCSEAMERMDDFGTLQVFKGSTTFHLCPMCKKKSTDSPTSQQRKEALLSSRNDNPGADRSAKSVAQGELLGTPGNMRRDAGDDDEDERFLHELDEDL